MLREILSVSGKSGLFKLISKGKNVFIVESLLDGKRIPVYLRDKVVALSDISIYTESEDLPLYKVFIKIKEQEGGKEIVFEPSIQPDELRTWFAELLPDYDKSRVYPSDIKKMMTWYNLLTKAGLNDFEAEATEEESEEDDTATETSPETGADEANATEKDS